MECTALKGLVRAGGPDRERAVSLAGGAEVASALRQAGHFVELKDVMPNDQTALDAFERGGSDVIFPVMHGAWGEGGGLQALLEARGLPFVGSTAATAALAMDKHRTRQLMAHHGLPIPDGMLLRKGDRLTLDAPLVFKPRREGSSIDVAICRDHAAVLRARRRLRRRHKELIAETYVTGVEVTVGTIDGASGVEALPAIRIVPGDGFYDYASKYDRDDTAYRFDLGFASVTIDRIASLAVKSHELLGCRHMARVDFIVEPDGTPWILELNSIPGFTTHSLLPMAAAHGGMELPVFVDRLVRMVAPIKGAMTPLESRRREAGSNAVHSTA